MIDMMDVVKRYVLGGEEIYALNHVSLHVDDGEYVAIIGPSGSGKSTLMNIIGCLDVPDSGSYLLNGKPINKYTQRQLAQVRNRQIGFIFQGFHLLGKLTALENVELPDKRVNPLDLEDQGRVLARGGDADARAAFLQRPDQPDRHLADLDALPPDPFLERVVLAPGETVDGVGAGWVVRRAFG